MAKKIAGKGQSTPQESVKQSTDFGTEADFASSLIFDLEQQDIYIRGIVHDVNNNLMVIMGACDQLENLSQPVIDISTELNLIRTHLHYASSQLRDLVNSQQMDKPMVMTQEQLNHFLNSTLASLSLIAGEKARIELGSTVILVPVHVHRKLLFKVLLQLIRNIVETEVLLPLALISVRQVEQWCEISVADNGPGIVGVDPQDIFKPGVTTRGKEGDGRGYGLSTVARAVDDWGGQCGVEAISADSGCRFWVRLPTTIRD